MVLILIHVSLKHRFTVARNVRLLLCRIIEGLIVAYCKGRIEVAENIPPPISCVFRTRCCPLGALYLGPAHARLVRFMSPVSTAQMCNVSRYYKAVPS
jgi:hypothetical protein